MLCKDFLVRVVKSSIADSMAPKNRPQCTILYQPSGFMLFGVPLQNITGAKICSTASGRSALCCELSVVTEMFMSQGCEEYCSFYFINFFHKDNACRHCSI